MLFRSLVADGCSINEGAVIENSIVGLRCVIGSGVTIRNSVLMGADYYEGSVELEEDQIAGKPPIGIGAGSLVDGAIIDKNCHIGRNVRIVNESGIVNSEDDDKPFTISDGIITLEKGASLPDGWRL